MSSVGYGDDRRGRRRDLEFPARVPLPRAILTLAITLVLLVPVASAPVAGAGTDSETQRDEVLDRREQVATELDLLRASDAEVDAVLDDLEEAVAAQQAAVDEADDAQRAAEDDVRDAQRALRTAERDVARLESAIREMAIASYMHPPTADLVLSLEASSFSDVLLQRAYLDARARRDVRLLDLLEVAEANAVERAETVEIASAEAAAAAESAEAALDGLLAEQSRQLQFAVRLQDRIDASLAEAAVLADLDAELAQQIMAEQEALIARIPAPPEVAPLEVDEPTLAVPTSVPVTTTTTSLPGTTTPLSPTATTTTTTTTVSSTTTPDDDGDDDEVQTRREAPPKPPLRTVQGISVHADIAADIDALLTAAAADGIELSGWGYRSTERQIELRIAHCGPTDYDIWERPASLCRPPTAPPGRSLHEQGRAIDFTYEGRVITSRSSDAFAWLDEHAASYGLKNLPSEPWHWSTSGG